MIKNMVKDNMIDLFIEIYNNHNYRLLVKLYFYQNYFRLLPN